MKVLIAGDSFAADWTVKHPTVCGWPNLLAKKYDVINIAQAGVGEYKIWKQIKSQDILLFDFIIISHTSPVRVNTIRHPIHCGDILHNDADLLISDVQYHSSKLRNILNTPLKTSLNWFKYHYDNDYQMDMYSFIYNDICRILKNSKKFVMSNFNNGIIDNNAYSYAHLLKTNSGIANHFDDEGNRIIYEDIEKCIMS